MPPASVTPAASCSASSPSERGTSTHAHAARPPLGPPVSATSTGSVHCRTASSATRYDRVVTPAPPASPQTASSGPSRTGAAAGGLFARLKACSGTGTQPIRVGASAVAAVIARLLGLVPVRASAAPRERVDRGPDVAVVLGDHLVADRDLGRIGRERPILARPNPERDLAVPTRAVEPQHLRVAALDRLQPPELVRLALGELDRLGDERDLLR